MNLMVPLRVRIASATERCNNFRIKSHINLFLYFKDFYMCFKTFITNRNAITFPSLKLGQRPEDDIMTIQRFYITSPF